VDNADISYGMRVRKGLEVERGMRGDSKATAVVCFITVTAFLFTAALSGCGGKDQGKQQFADGVVRLIRENQSQPEIKEEGKEAFQRYYQSGFSDLESAAAAAESFEKSNEKDRGTLQELASLEKPDDRAAEIAAGLEEGIRTMDEGNARYAEELRRAPEQSHEERANIDPAGKAIMERYYLVGLDAIISALEGLSAYVRDNGLKGEEQLRELLEGLRQERRDLELSMQYM